MMIRPIRLTAAWLAALITVSYVQATCSAQQVIPIAVQNRNTLVSFEEEILPVLQKNCLACHSASDPEAELVLETPQSILKGGDSGPAVVPMKSDESLLLQVSSHREEPHMPPAKNDVAAVDLTPQELGLIKLWIDQGAKGSGATAMLSPQKWRSLPPGLHPIYAVAVTPDGQYAACGRANQIFIYHVATGQLITRLTDPELQAASKDGLPGIAHLDVVQALKFNGAGDMLASGGFRVVKLWRRPSDVRRLNLAATDAVTAVAASPDGKMTATAIADNTIKLWNVATGEPGPVLLGHAAKINSLQFAPDSTKLISASSDKTIRIWDTAEGKLLGQIDTASEINAVALVDEPVATPAVADAAATAPAEAAAAAEVAVEQPRPVQRIVSGGADNMIRMWKQPSGLAETLADLPAKPNLLAVSRDRKLLAVANAEGTISVLQFDTRQPIKSWKAHEGAITSISFRPVPPVADAANAADAEAKPEAVQLATAGADNTIRIWNAETGEPLDVIYGGLVPVQALEYQPDGKRIVSGAGDGKVTIWNLEAAPALTLENGDTGPAAITQVSPDGKLLAASGVSNTRPAIIVRDIATGKITHTLLGHEAAITALAFNADGTKLVSGSQDKTARVWNLQDDKFPELARFAGHAGAVNAVAFNADAAQVLSGAADNSLKLWAVADETEVMNFAGHTAPVVAVAMVANQPVSASADKTVRVWNPANGQAARTITDPAVITAMSIGRDGVNLAIAGADMNVRVYQFANGQLLQTLTGHTAAINSVAFSADNARLVTGGADKQTLVWNVPDGRLLEILPVPAGLASNVFGTDGTTVLIADAAGEIKLQPLHFSMALNGLLMPVTAVAYSGNGQIVYTACADGTVRGFNTTNATQVFSANHAAPVHGLALSPNDQLLASAGEDKLIKLWNAANGAAAQPPQLAGFTAPVTKVFFSADGTRLAGASNLDTGELLVFNIANPGDLEQSIVGGAAIQALVAAGDTPSAERIVGVMGDQGHVWEMLSLGRVVGHTQPVTSLAAIPDSPLQVLSGSLDGTLRRWNLTNGQALLQMNHGGPINAVAVRGDAQRFASASENNTAKLWNAANGQQLAEMRGDIRAKGRVAKLTQQQNDVTAQIAALQNVVTAAEAALPVKTTAATAAADVLAKADADLKVKSDAFKVAADAKSAAEKVAIEAAAAAQKAAAVKAVADKAVADAEAAMKTATDDAARAASLAAASPADTTLAQANTVAQQAVVAATAKVQAAKAALVAPTQAAATAAKAAEDAATKTAATNKPFTDAMVAVVQAEAAQNLAAQNNAVALREAKEATDAVPASKAAKAAAEANLVKAKADLEAAVKIATETEKPIRSLAFSPDNQLLATGGGFGVVHTWNADNGVEVASYVGHAGSIQNLSFINNDALISGSADKTAAVWDLNPAWVLERTIGSISDPTKLSNRVVAIDFSDDGQLLVTGGGIPSRGGEVKIWKVEDGSLVQSIPDAHTDAVFGVAFSRDGKYIASAGADKYVRTFDVATGKQVRQFEGHTNHVLSVSWRADGTMLASCGADSMVMIWNAETGDRLQNIAGFAKQVSMVRFVGNTNITVACSGDRILRMHNADNAGVVSSFAGTGEDFLYSVDVTPDRAVLIAGGYDSVLRIWNGNAANSQPLKIIEPPQEAEAVDQVTQAAAAQAGK